MDESADQHLLALLQSTIEGRTSSSSLNMAVERLFAELLGGQLGHQTGNRRGPDILVTKADALPVAIELKILSKWGFKKNFQNRVSDMLAMSVQMRRAFRGEARLAAVVLLRGDADGESVARSEAMPAAELATQLVRAEDGVGYDSVLVGKVAAEIEWRFFQAASGVDFPESSQPSSTREALSLLTMTHPLSVPRVTKRPTQHLDRFLLIADEWRSGRGGISTVNRELAIALAAEGVDAAVMVPQASAEDIKAASDADVAIVTPAQVPGLSSRESLLLRPIFADQSWEPDVIVGHGRILGPYAAAQQQYFPEARRVHFVHTDAEQLESAKEELGGGSRMLDADARRRLEQELAKSAHLVVGVGPLLTADLRDELIGREPESDVICLMPGLREAFDVSAALAPVRNHVLIVGRADDFHAKGIDIAAEAMLKVVEAWPPSKPHRPVLIIRGVPDEVATRVKSRLDSILEGRVGYHLRPFSESETEVTQDLAQARVLLMPSRHEGFGLAAYEAIASGVPVIISAESGLAHFLRESSIDSSPSSVASTRDSQTRLAVDVWADAIERVLNAPDVSRTQAITLRDSIAGVVDWSRSVDKLLRALAST